VSGYQKLGTYTGNGSAGQAITTGFKPDFVLIKSTVGADNWRLYDTIRGITGGGYLEPNRTDGDDTSNAPNLTMTSTGFTITSGGVSAGNNVNGNLYIYWAMAKNVASNTTLANSFKAVTYTGNSSGGNHQSQSITGFGFKPDLIWIKERSGTGNHYLQDTLRGLRSQISSNLTAAETTYSSNITSYDTDGVTLGTATDTNNNGSNYIAWAWKAGNTWQSNVDGTIPSTVNTNTANGFSIVKYVGDGNSARTVGHGLTAKCDLVIIKGLDSADKWIVQLPQLGDNARMVLEGTAAKTDDSTTAQAGNTTVFGIGSDNSVNKSGDDFIAYCFHSVSGYSKIGSYTGNGSSNSITTGFQPDFVLIKNTGRSGTTWNIQDSVRGTTKYLMAQSSDSESTDSGINLTFTSTGFTLNNSYQGWNENGDSYIYMAIKMN